MPSPAPCCTSEQKYRLRLSQIFWLQCNMVIYLQCLYIISWFFLAKAVKCRTQEWLTSDHPLQLHPNPWIKKMVRHQRQISIGKQLFCCFWLFHILMPYNMILYFCLPYFHVSNNALFCTWYFSTFILYRRSLDTFYWLLVGWIYWSVYFVTIVWYMFSFIKLYYIWMFKRYAM